MGLVNHVAHALDPRFGVSDREGPISCVLHVKADVVQAVDKAAVLLGREERQFDTVAELTNKPPKHGRRGRRKRDRLVTH
eukprot:9477928-Pyramimonas_sp.AAC.1